MTTNNLNIIPAKLLPAMIRELLSIFKEIGVGSVTLDEKGGYKCTCCGHTHAWSFEHNNDYQCRITICPIKRVIRFTGTWLHDFLSKLPDEYRLKGYKSGWQIIHEYTGFVPSDPEPGRCNARTRKGTRCKNKAHAGGFCKIHQGYEDQPRAVGNRLKGKLTGMGL